MSDGRPSITAQRVAAYRLTFERIGTPYGQPAADEALAGSVAGTEPVDVASPMARYLRGRTTFFDRAVVNALDREVAQVVTIGAGYDGRAWRFAKDGVHWWEVDRPATQTDKRLRLSQLGIDSSHVRFVAHDLESDGLATRLLAAEFEADAPSLIIAEGIAVYLDPASLARTLDELRSVATVGSRLAVSLGSSLTSPAQAERRARLEAVLASWGEPARNSIDGRDASLVLTAARWRPLEVSERSRAAGFIMAAPVWSPAIDPQAPSRSRIGAFLEQTWHRSDTRGLGGHLESVYRVAVTAIHQLDLGVYRVDRADGTRWVARIFPASRSFEATQWDAGVLDWLSEAGLPSERRADAQAVSDFGGQPVLVTSFAPGRQAGSAPAVFHALGQLLGRVQVLPPGPPGSTRTGGAWHHLALDAGPGEELLVTRSLIEAASARVGASDRIAYDALRRDLDRLEAFDDLPTAFGHPDLVPRNVIAAPAGDCTIIDWTGAGRAPRILPLGCLLGAAAGRLASVQSAAGGYRATVALSDRELERIELAMWHRPLVLACWSFAVGRASLPDTTDRWQAERAKIRRAAPRARAALGEG